MRSKEVLNQDNGNANSKKVTDLKRRQDGLIIFKEGEVRALMFGVRATDSNHLVCNIGHLMLPGRTNYFSP